MEPKDVVRRFVDEAVNGGALRSRRRTLHAGSDRPGARLVRLLPSLVPIAAVWGIQDSLDRFQQVGLEPDWPGP